MCGASVWDSRFRVYAVKHKDAQAARISMVQAGFRARALVLGL